MTYPNPETVGRETLEESNSERNTRDLQIRGRERLRPVRDLISGFFAYCQKIDTPEFFTVLFFTRKDSTVNVIEGGWALSRLQNAETSNIW